MYSSIVLGLLAIYLAIVQLGTHWSMKVFWVGLIVYGVIKVIEGLPRLSAAVQARRTIPPTA